ncbi:uncharacterized protein LOC131627080 [Vicia villosa]|uniref:uncharacterized protein LOC131627080 n=1 Tax=Vicia villosa TaxID=3911 RepID=UPI00273B7415|nr:uncharacterized protein LOC131627080 [Vicia villosa]
MDLGQEYYLVTFTIEEDQYFVLMDGPWLIYDHYLLVREWKPNFCPSSDAIEQVAVWVRVSGLPIEYYDARVHIFIGNCIRVTFKVDRNTMSKERGKYARLCVQVNLSKSLLAMFAIKGRHYKIEYEGLHLLCLRYGFGHFKEGCEDQTKLNGKGLVTEVRNFLEKGNIPNQIQEGEQNEDGPWKVTQKTRRTRKGKEIEKNGWQPAQYEGPPSIQNTNGPDTGSIHLLNQLSPKELRANGEKDNTMETDISEDELLTITTSTEESGTRKEDYDASSQVVQETIGDKEAEMEMMEETPGREHVPTISQ